jgi:hypothetical protein
MTVLENVKVAFHCRQKAGLPAAVFRAPEHSSEEARVDRESRELLKIFHLEAAAGEKARNLPYGSQRRLEIARAMATSPKLLLLDEPAAGMNPHEAQGADGPDPLGAGPLRHGHPARRANMKVVMGICEIVHALDYGSTIAIGKPAEIQSNPKVIRSVPGRRMTESAGGPDPRGPRPARLLRGDRGLEGRLADAPGRRDRDAHRGQRRREDDHAARHLGLVPAKSGEVFFRGEPIRSRPTFKLVRQGLILVPEGTRDLRQPDRAGKTWRWGPTRATTAGSPRTSTRSTRSSRG